jgi:hypothetical protein
MSLSAEKKALFQDINLSILKRLDPDIEQVLGNAAHVCLYAMTMDNPVWVSICCNRAVHQVHVRAHMDVLTHTLWQTHAHTGAQKH